MYFSAHVACGRGQSPRRGHDDASGRVMPPQNLAPCRVTSGYSRGSRDCHTSCRRSRRSPRRSGRPPSRHRRPGSRHPSRTRSRDCSPCSNRRCRSSCCTARHIRCWSCRAPAPSRRKTVPADRACRLLHRGPHNGCDPASLSWPACPGRPRSITGRAGHRTAVPHRGSQTHCAAASSWPPRPAVALQFRHPPQPAHAGDHAAMERSPTRGAPWPCEIGSRVVPLRAAQMESG
jgi:hypothetical protein